MTTMMKGIYVLLAVVVGVMLVGFIPGQLSNFASPIKTETTGSFSVRALNDTTSLSKIGGAPAEANESGTTRVPTSDPYLEVKYYSFWVLGLIVSLAFYFIAKRQLG